MAQIRVFGISPKTHFAMVLVEADYRMKRIAIGVEPPPVRMTTFAMALQVAATGEPATVVVHAELPMPASCRRSSGGGNGG